MNEHDEENDFMEEEPGNESHIIGMLKKIQQQLAFLEKKIDALVGQSQNRPPRDRNFSKPFRPGGFRSEGRRSDRDHRSGERRHDGNRSDDRRHEGGRPFENSNPRRNRGFEKKKEFYGRDR